MRRGLRAWHVVVCASTGDSYTGSVHNCRLLHLENWDPYGRCKTQRITAPQVRSRRTVATQCKIARNARFKPFLHKVRSAQTGARCPMVAYNGAAIFKHR
jgi:hypothetical protein